MKRYLSKESKTIWLVLMALAVINIFLYEPRFLFFPYLFLLLLFLAIFVRYELIMDEEKGQLSFIYKLFQFSFLTRVANANTIREAYFIKLGKKPVVLLKIKGSLRWKLSNFQPTEFDQELYQFVQKQQIPTKKLNGYGEES